MSEPIVYRIRIVPGTELQVFVTVSCRSASGLATAFRIEESWGGETRLGECVGERRKRIAGMQPTDHAAILLSSSAPREQRAI